MQGLSFKLLREIEVLDETCPKHPDVKLRRLPNKTPFCPVCVADGIREDTRQMADFAADEIYHRKYRGALERESIFDDDEIKDANFDNFETKKGTEAYNNWLKARHVAASYLDDDFNPNTILLGPPGTGKTHLAMAMVNAVNKTADPEIKCVFASVNEVVRRVKNSFSDKSNPFTEEYATQLLASANLLVLDDLGSEAVFRSDNRASQASDWVQQFLFGVLNKHRGRVIVTTNLTSEQLTYTYNSKLLSRLYRGTVKNQTLIKFTKKTKDKRLEMF